MLTAKKATILIMTVVKSTDVSAIPVIKVNAIIPNTSSIKAAPRMAFPLGVDNFPISFKVSTLMDTEVAVKITPINMFSKNALSPLL